MVIRLSYSLSTSVDIMSFSQIFYDGAYIRKKKNSQHMRSNLKL